MAITLADLVVFLGADRSGLDRDLDTAERDTRNFAQRAGSGIANVMGGAVVAGAAAAGAAIIGVGVASFDMASDVDEAMRGMSNRIGGFELQADKLKGAMLDVFGDNFTGTVEEAGQSIEQVFVAAGQAAREMSQEELSSVTEQALSMADVFGVDVADSVRVAASMVNNGLAPSFESAFDTMIAGYQNGVNLQGDLLDTLNEYSDDFADMGFTADETLAILNTGLINGALNTDKIADAMNEFGVNMRDPAIRDSIGEIDSGLLSIYDRFQSGQLTEGEALMQMIDGLNGVDDAIARDQAGVLLFRSMWEDMGETAILSLTNYQEELMDTSGTADALANRQLSLGQRLQGIWRRLQVTALLPIGETLMDIAERAMPYVEQGAAWLAERLPGFMEQVIAAFDRVRVFIVNTLWPAVQPFFAWLINTALPNLVSFVQNTLLPALSNLINWLVNTALPAVSNFIQTRVIPAIQSIVNFVQNTLVPGIQRGIEIIRGIINGIVNFIQTYVMPVINRVFKIAGQGWQALLAAFRGDWYAFGSYLRNAFDLLMRSIMNLLRGLVRRIGDIMRQAVEAIRNINWAAVGRSIIQGIINGVNSGANAAQQAMRNVGNAMLNSVKGFFRIRSPSGLFADEVGAPIAQGIGQGVTDEAGSISNAVQGAVQGATTPGTNAGGIGGAVGRVINFTMGDITINGDSVTIEQVRQVVIEAVTQMIMQYDNSVREAYVR